MATAKANIDEDELRAETDEEVEARLEEEIVGDTALALPDEELEVINQVTKLSEFTVRPGLMKLPVTAVTSTEDSDRVIITLQHPTEGDIRVRFKKTDGTKTWSSNSELKRMLDWYGISMRSLHSLKSQRLYVKYDPDNTTFGDGNWRVVRPPAEWRRDVRRYKDAAYSLMPEKVQTVIAALMTLRRGMKRKINWAVPEGSYASLYSIVLLFGYVGLTAGMLWQTGLGMSASTAFVGAVTYLVASLIGAATGIIVLEPPEE